MTLRDDIAAALRPVVSVMAGFGAAWQYRQMTSEPDVDARTYGAWTPIDGHQSARNHSEPFQDQRNVWVRSERCSFRVADNSVTLVQGDQMRDGSTSAATAWAVMGVASAGPGTVRYDLARDVPLLAEGNRNGGV